MKKQWEAAPPIIIRYGDRYERKDHKDSGGSMRTVDLYSFFILLKVQGKVLEAFL